MEKIFKKIKHKIRNHMLIESLFDYAVIRIKYKAPPLFFLYNVMIGQKHRMHFYKNLKATYLKKALVERDWEHKEKVKNVETVWVCWLQGIENAPLLVKRCVQSLHQKLPDKNIVILDEHNIFSYIQLPEIILTKWKSGIISIAHFSDLVRLQLLIHHGGYWIDATVLCTDGSLLKLIDTQPLFMFSFYNFGFNPEIMELNNWLIYSTTNNNILCLTKEMLCQYWKDHNYAVDYFIFQLFLTIALEYYSEDYKKMPIVSQVDSHILATYILEPYDEMKFKILKSTTGFHKLSTRFNQEGLKQKDTFYDVVIRRNQSGILEGESEL